MKTKHFILSFLFLMILQSGFAQNTGSIGDDPIGQHKLNFAVPDLPAFKALGSEPSTILRPSTPESFSLILSQFYNGDNISLPANFAAEIAPWILVKSNKITLSDYRDHALLYSSRVSLGTSRDSLNNYNFAIGLRFSVIDKGDLKNDPIFLNLLIEKLKKQLDQKEKIREQYMLEHSITEEEYASNPELIEQEVAKLVQGNIDLEIEAMKKAYKEVNWNREKLDFAFATVGYSTDSTGNNPGFKSFDGWISYALPVFKMKDKNETSEIPAQKFAGQLLFGGNLKTYENRYDRKTYFNAFANTRLYIGTNRIKGFGEIQYSYLAFEESNHLLMTLGGEINPIDGVWLEFYAGMERNTSINLNSSVARFNLRFSIPEKFNLF
jgi:hypothetical protein